jgi:hypothetical protein
VHGRIGAPTNSVLEEANSSHISCTFVKKFYLMLYGMEINVFNSIAVSLCRTVLTCDIEIFWKVTCAGYVFILETVTVNMFECSEASLVYHRFPGSRELNMLKHFPVEVVGVVISNSMGIWWPCVRWFTKQSSITWTFHKILLAKKKKQSRPLHAMVALVGRGDIVPAHYLPRH